MSRNKATFTSLSGVIGGWALSANTLYKGTYGITSGYTPNPGDLTLRADSSGGSIHAYNFYINPDGSIGIREALITSEEDDVGTYRGMIKLNKNHFYVDTSGGYHGFMMINYYGGSPSSPYYNRYFRVYDGYQNLMIDLAPTGNGGVTLAQLNLYPKFINMPNLPTSGSGLPSGALYASGGYVRIVS